MRRPSTLTATPSALAAVSNDARCNEKSMSWQHLLRAPQGGRPASSCCQLPIPVPEYLILNWQSLSSPICSASLSCGCGSVVRGAINCHSNQLATTGGNTSGNRWVTNGQSTGQPTGAHAPHQTQTRPDQDTVLCGLWHMSWLGCCM